MAGGIQIFNSEGRKGQMFSDLIRIFSILRLLQWHNVILYFKFKIVFHY